MQRIRIVFYLYMVLQFPVNFINVNTKNRIVNNFHAYELEISRLNTDKNHYKPLKSKRVRRTREDARPCQVTMQQFA